METPQKRTSQERQAVFSDALKDMAPTDKKKAAANDLLAEWIPEIKRARAQGYSWKQTATILRLPQIGICISPEALRKRVQALESAAKPSIANGTGTYRPVEPETTPSKTTD